MKNLREGLIGEWLFNGDAKDTSGNGNHGTVTGATLAQDNLGRNNRAYNLTVDGSDYINIDGVLTQAGTNTAGSLRAIASQEDIANTACHVFAFGDTNTQDRLILYITGGKVRAICSDGAAVTAWDLQTDSAVMSSGGVVDITLVQDGTEPVIYVNGDVPAQTFNTSTDKTAWLNDLVGRVDNARLGSRNYNSVGDGNCLEGSLELAQIWNRALDADEVWQLYTGIEGNYQGLFDDAVCLFDFRDDTLDCINGHKITAFTGSLKYTDNRFGIANHALAPNGTNDRYIIADHADFSFTDGNDLPFTIALAVNPKTVDAVKDLLSRYENPYEWILYMSAAGGVIFLLADGVTPAGNNLICSSTNFMTSNNIATIVITYDGSESSAGFEIYGNGVNVTNSRSENGTYTGCGNTASDMWLGYTSNISPYYSNLQYEFITILKGKEWTAEEALSFHNLITIKHLHPYRRSA